jgi:hypothetical protein
MNSISLWIKIESERKPVEGQSVMIQLKDGTLYMGKYRKNDFYAYELNSNIPKNSIKYWLDLRVPVPPNN